MFKHNLILTFRSFKRNKASFLINLIGLSTGLACALLILLWVNDELKMDKFHEKEDQLYQVLINATFPNGNQIWEGTPGPFAAALVAEVPEIEAATQQQNTIFSPKGVLIDQNQEKLEVAGLFADEHYFEVFSHPIIAGNAPTVLTDKNNIVLSEAAATKIFNSPEAAIGETLEWKNEYFEETFQVSGVYENPPNHSTNKFDAVVHYDWLVKWDEYAGDWSGGYAYTYIVAKEGIGVEALNEKIEQVYKSKRTPNKPMSLFVRKYSDKYLYGNYENGIQTGGRIAYVKLFSIIALFIVLIACINFMNLSTAQASKKLKQIGVKKAIGVRRPALIVQFLSESLLMSFLALVLATSIVNISIPQFNELTGKDLAFHLSPTILLSMLGIGLITGLLAGSYPAFYLSSFKPAAVLKGQLNTYMGDQWVRKGLVVFQFSLSIIFIVGVFVIHQQMKLTQTQNLGYDRENVLTFQRIKNDGDPQVFMSELRNIPGVVNAGNMYSNITNNWDNQGGYSWRGVEEDRSVSFEAPRIGYEVIETLGMEVLAGRTFSKELKDDHFKIVINETAAKMMGLENPVGTFIKKDRGENARDREIIGVVKDFQYGSIHKKIEPIILRFRNYGMDMMVRLKAGEERTTIPKIEKLFKEFHPEYTFKYSFLDEEYQKLYESESKIAVLSKYFSGLAILISCLGLFGLAMFTAERRKKEIGIRKVLGSSVFGIVQMLTRDFSKTVLIAILIALPVSYLIAMNWLTNFAYKIDLHWWYFIIPGFLVLFIAWSTVGLQTIQAARVNPVDCLKED